MSGNKKSSGCTVVGLKILLGTISNQASSITAPTDCEALIWVNGGGGGAASANGTGGGAGGGAAYKRIALRKGQSISLQAGGAVTDANGGTSNAVLPTGVVVQATGGAKGTGGGFDPPAAAGIGSGGDINRTGGAGGRPTSPDGADAGPGGGLGGASTSLFGGGGGGAGFGDVGAYLAGGSGGSNSANSGSVGAGAYGAGSPGVGRAIVLLLA